MIYFPKLRFYGMLGKIIPWWEDDLITSSNQNSSIYQLNKTTVALSYSLSRSPNLRFSKTVAVKVNYK